MVVEVSVTGTVVRIEHQTDEFEWRQADMLLVCQLDDGGEGLREAREAPAGMTLGVLGARVRVVDDWGLPELSDVEVGDFIYASGDWLAPGSHDMEQDLRFVEAARDWYRLENWDAGEGGRLKVRALDIIGFDVRRYIVSEARWQQLTDEWRSWEHPYDHDAGWHVHRRAVGGRWSERVAWDQDAIEALDRDAEIGQREISRRWQKDFTQKLKATRRAERDALRELAKLPEVQAQKEAARKLASRGRKGKGGKRKRRK